MKLGLLRQIAGDDLRLGVNWYLVPNENHNADGKHVSYLEPGNAIGRRLKACDPPLHEALSVMKSSRNRSVESLEESGVLPGSHQSYLVPLTKRMSTGERLRWHKGGLGKMQKSDLVFLDPDNGLRKEPGPKLEKYALASEVGDYFAQGHSVVVYHHADRSKGGVPVQVARRLNELGEAVGGSSLGAVIARRGTCRFFLIAAQDDHRRLLLEGLKRYISVWQGHAELVLLED